MKNKKIYIWCCDINKKSGEGILANKFINDLKLYNENLKIDICSPSKKYNNIFFDRIIHPFKGLFYLWYIFIFKKNKRICFLNYLPFWNFFLLGLLPPNTILGPITGGSLFLKKPISNYILRKYFLIFLFNISKFIIKFRFKKLLFSTDLLKNNLKNKNNYYFNYVLKDLKINKSKIKKKYDIAFYLRKHKNKNFDLQVKLAKKLAKKYKIIIFGEKLLYKNIKNTGFISRQKLLVNLKKTKFCFLSPENLYSLFAIDSICSGANIFFHKYSYYRSKNITGIIYLNYNNFNSLIKNIRKRFENHNSHKIKIYPINYKFEDYFKLKFL